MDRFTLIKDKRLNIASIGLVAIGLALVCGLLAPCPAPFHAAFLAVTIALLLPALATLFVLGPMVLIGLYAKNHGPL
jgi:hypothetical protein